MPCVGYIRSDGRIHVEDSRHIDDDREERLMKDPESSRKVSEEWLLGTSADPKMNRRGRKKEVINFHNFFYAVQQQ